MFGFSIMAHSLELQIFSSLSRSRQCQKRASMTKIKDGTTGGRRVFFLALFLSSLLIRHNLDVMHTEKNICGSILGTLKVNLRTGRRPGLTCISYEYLKITIL